jgi:hypothetical protein
MTSSRAADEHLLPSDPHLDGLALMARDLHRATEAAGLIEHFYAVGPQVVRLRFAGPTLVEPLTRAIRHLSHDPVDDPDLTVNIWDSATTGVPLSPLLQALVDSLYGNPFALLTPRHEIAALSNDRVAATFELGSGVLTLFDRCRNEVVYWVSDPPNLPYYEKGAPFRTTFNWWLSAHGMQCIHAAAVGIEHGAVLLTGRGGSGKSTTALACITSSLKYLSDDYCAFSTTGDPEVFSLYNTGKLTDDVDLERQPHFAPWVVNPERAGDEKYLMYLAEHVPDRIIRQAPLRAIVMPRVTGASRPRLEPVSAAAALRALAPTSMFQLPGSGGDAFFRMAWLARALPCYALECSLDLAANTRLLEELVRDLSPG